MQQSLVTKCYYELRKTPPNAAGGCDSMSLRALFLIATESSFSRKWRLNMVEVDVDQQDMDQSLLNIYPVDENLEVDHIFDRLSGFEQEKEHAGSLICEGISFPRSTYFRDVAQEYDLVLNEDTQRYMLVDETLVPDTSGSFTLSDLYGIAAKKEQDEKMDEGAHPSVFDQYVKGYGHDLPFDLAPIFKNMELVATMADIAKGYDRVLSALKNAIRVRSYVELIGRFDYTEKVKYDKNIAKSIKNIRQRVSQNRDALGSYITDYMDDLLRATEIYVDVLRLQFQFINTLENKESATKDQFEADIVKLVAKHKVPVRFEHHIGRAAVDVENLEIPQAFRDALEALETTVGQLQDLEKEIRQSSVRNGVSVREVNVAGFKSKGGFEFH